MITKHSCPICKHKISAVTNEKSVAGIKFVTYQPCNHTDQISDRFHDFSKLVSQDGKNLRPYQVAGAKFVVNADGRALIADDMGIGKTWQACSIIKEFSKEFKSVIIICKKTLTIQWTKEIIRFCGPEFVAQTIESENDYLLPVKCYILSYDILAGHSHERKTKSGSKVIKRGIQDLESLIEKIDPSLIIMDEVQHIKNHESKRAQAVRKACKYSKHIIALSGTPIKNNAKEYFSILNILHPEIPGFGSFADYDRKFLQSYWTGYGMKTGGLKDNDYFREVTEKFIIRRTRAEVLPDLPKIDRQTQFCDLGNVVESMYIDTLKQFQDYINNQSGQDNAMQKNACILAYLSKMRHLTGLAKIEPCLDYIEDFITSTDRKIIVFLHHKDVAKILITKLEEALKNEPAYGSKILRIDSSMTVHERNQAVDDFKTDKNRIIVCSTLASGEGIDGLQCASDCIFLERQWNPSNEEQAEARIARLGQLNTNLTAAYFIAVGTVDEFFTELVEKKRAIVSSVLDYTDMKWDETSIMKELVDILTISGGKKWGF